eukprot:GHUV01010753.1.p1 GENE.GHUV01010753.1~~GHUV01010753.1.p1  ORF type:complete len:141 (-),score=8.85 GHUV01010753.1:402-824(-)
MLGLSAPPRPIARLGYPVQCFRITSGYFGGQQHAAATSTVKTRVRGMVGSHKQPEGALTVPIGTNLPFLAHYTVPLRGFTAMLTSVALCGSAWQRAALSFRHICLPWPGISSTRSISLLALALSTAHPRYRALAGTPGAE